MAAILFSCHRFSSFPFPLSQSLSLQQYISWRGQRFLRYEQEWPLSSASFLLCSSSNSSASEVCHLFLPKRKERKKHSKKKKNRESPSPHVWHKENNSHDLYFCNPRPPLTPTPVVITQHVIVITWNLFLKVPIQWWRCLNTHWKYTKHMSNFDPAFPADGLVSSVVHSAHLGHEQIINNNNKE